MTLVSPTGRTLNERDGWAAGDVPRTEYSAALHDFSAMSDAQLGSLNMAAVNLRCAVGLPGAEDLDVGACLRKLDAWTDLVRINTQHWWPDFVRSPATYEHSPGRFRIMALVTVVQRDLGVRYNRSFSEGEYDARDARNLFLHGVLFGHGGTCVTMPVLYIAIGRALGYPLWLVQAKEHLFARWEEPSGERFNIECTCPGFAAPDDAYYHRRPKPLTAQDIASGQFLRSLSPRDELAVFLKERGQCLMDNLRLAESVEALYYANQLAPDLRGAECAWATATVLYRGVEEAKRRARLAGYNCVDPASVPLPLLAGDPAGCIRSGARMHLERIVRLRSRDQVPAHDLMFREFVTR
jgi:hypothetical protein